MNSSKTETRTTLLQILDTPERRKVDIASDREGEAIMNTSLSVRHNLLTAIGDEAKLMCCVFRFGMILRAIDAMANFIRGSQED
jgi:hypothetical protein